MALREVADPQHDLIVVPPDHIDAVWHNAFITQGKCHFIDLEWEQSQPLRLDTLTIRACYLFLCRVQKSAHVHLYLRTTSRRAIIRRMARAMDLTLAPDAFNNFVDLEARIQQAAKGLPPRATRIKLLLGLWLPGRALQALLPVHKRWKIYRERLFSLRIRIAHRLTVRGNFKTGQR